MNKSKRSWRFRSFRKRRDGEETLLKSSVGLRRGVGTSLISRSTPAWPPRPAELLRLSHSRASNARTSRVSLTPSIEPSERQTRALTRFLPPRVSSRRSPFDQSSPDNLLFCLFLLPSTRFTHNPAVLSEGKREEERYTNEYTLSRWSVYPVS